MSFILNTYKIRNISENIGICILTVVKVTGEAKVTSCRSHCFSQTYWVFKAIVFVKVTGAVKISASAKVTSAVKSLVLSNSLVLSK